MAGLFYHFLSGTLEDFWSITSNFDENICLRISFLLTQPWKPWKPHMTLVPTLNPTARMVVLIVAWQITTKTRACFFLENIWSKCDFRLIVLRASSVWPKSDPFQDALGHSLTIWEELLTRKNSGLWWTKYHIDLIEFVAQTWQLVVCLLFDREKWSLTTCQVLAKINFT